MSVKVIVLDMLCTYVKSDVRSNNPYLMNRQHVKSLKSQNSLLDL